MDDARTPDPPEGASKADELEEPTPGGESHHPREEVQPNVDVCAELAGRGHQAVTRVLDALTSDPRLTEAIDSLLAAKRRLSEATRGARSQLNVAAADSVHDLKERVVELEERLAKIEGRPQGFTGESALPRVVGATPPRRLRGSSAVRAIESLQGRLRTPLAWSRAARHRFGSAADRPLARRHVWFVKARA